MNDDRIVFGSALKLFADRNLSWRQRRQFRDYLDNDVFMDLAHLHFAERSLAVPLQGESLSSDTPILDKLGLWFQWLVENREEVLEFLTLLGEWILTLVFAFMDNEKSPAN